MLSKNSIIFITFCLFFSVSASSLTSDLSGTWKLEIKDSTKESKVIANVRFEHDIAQSCISGDWRVVTLVSIDASDEKLFPIEQPLSYQIEGEDITIGRNQRCDSYLHLNGKLDTSNITGDYYAFGLKHNKLYGHFTLRLID